MDYTLVSMVQQVVPHHVALSLRCFETLFRSIFNKAVQDSKKHTADRIYSLYILNRVIQDDEEHMVDHASVSKVRSGAQQLMAVSLNECFQLYTQEEKVSTRYTGHSRKYCDSFWFGLSAFGSNCLANIAGLVSS